MIVIMTHAFAFDKDAASFVFVSGILEKQFALTLVIDDHVFIGGVVKETAVKVGEGGRGVEMTAGVVEARCPSAQDATVTQ